MKSLLQPLNNSWRAMLAVNAAVVAGHFVYKVFRGTADFQYLHLIIDYHFGVTKRALMGTLVSLVLPKVPVYVVFILGGLAISLAFVLFLLVFRRAFGFRAETLPLLVFIAGSPFFFKNFVMAVGYFDVYGCIVALIVLLIPARSFFYVVIATAGCVVLVFMHHLHFLLYVPTIGTIVAIRYYFVREPTPLNILGGAAMVAVLGAAFVFLQFFGNMKVPMPELLAYLKTRVADPDFHFELNTVDVWYRPIENDMHSSRFVFWQNFARVPVYFALIALHWPLIRYFRGLVGALQSAPQRRLIGGALSLISLGYLIIFAVVFDWSRWISGWAVCMALVMMAVRDLPAAREAAPIDPQNYGNGLLGWIVTIIPRVGVTRPF